MYDGSKPEIFDLTIPGDIDQLKKTSGLSKLIEMSIGGFLVGIGAGLLSPLQNSESENLMIGDNMQSSDDVMFYFVVLNL